MILCLSSMACQVNLNSKKETTTLNEIHGLQISSSPSSMLSNFLIDILMPFDGANFPHGTL
jgi:hypothetical protein